MPSSDHIKSLNASLEGRYHVESTLGEGGMGSVYLAEQFEPIRRRVALKLLRPGAHSHDVIARFEAERQALAMMDHPSIAKAFDAGVTTDGRSYFVMELVAGLSLTTYCDDARLTVRERVELLVDVCHAVQHAHQKGVIHRDLKPSNILVSDTDGRPLPRIIDFGIAKATQANEFDGTQLTRDDQVVGTPAYMSPEQMNGSGSVDTRTDIYAIGVLLYEILVGHLPYDASSYRGWAAIAARLDEDPPTPKQRFRELGDTQETVAELRSTTPGLLRRELAGDIGWITSRAMERDPERRYETANALALDLGRYLSHEPVRARGANTAYVVRKFVRRNRLAVSFGAVLALGLTGFSIVTSVQSNRVAQARDEADVRRSQAEGLIDFMLSDLRAKLEPLGQLPILNDVNAQAIEYFSSIPQEKFTDSELASWSQSLLQGGAVQLGQGDFASAGRAFDESLRQAKALSDRQPDNAERLFGLSQSHFYVGYAAWLDGDLDTAEAQFRDYLEVAERMVEREPENPEYRREIGFALGNLGSVREARGDLKGALEVYVRSREEKEALVERDSSNVDSLGELAETHNKLGVVLEKLGEYEAALEQHRLEFQFRQQVLEIDPQHAYWRFRAAVALGFVANLRRTTGDAATAVSLATDQLAVLDSLSSFDPSNTEWSRARVSARSGRAESLTDLDRLAEAEADLEVAERQISALLTVDSTAMEWRGDLASVQTKRATVQLLTARPAAALQSATAAVALIEQAPQLVTRRAKELVRARLVRGHALAALQRGDEAREEWAQALSLIESFPTESVDGEFKPLLAEAFIVLGRASEAARALDELDRSGYVDPQLAALAIRSGIQ